MSVLDGKKQVYHIDDHGVMWRIYKIYFGNKVIWRG